MIREASALCSRKTFVTDDGALEGVNVGRYERFTDENSLM